MKCKISSLQIMSLTYFIVIAANMGITSHLLLSNAKEDTCIAIIVGYFIGLIPFFINLFIMKKYPDLNLFEKNKKIFGNKLGVIINTIITISIFYMAIVCFWDLIDFITSQYLSETPKFAVALTFMVPLIYLLTKDFKVLCRTTFILFILSLILIVLTILGLFWQINLTNLLPILKDGIAPPLKNSIQQVAYNSLSLILLTIIPLNSIMDKKNLKKRMFLGYTIAILLMLIFMFFVVTILGVPLANLYQYPEYTLLKKVSLIGFLERMESTLSIRWIFYLFIIITMCLTFVKFFIKDTFNIKNDNKTNITIIIIAIVVTILSDFIFPNNTVSEKFINNKLYIFLLIIDFLIPLIIVIRLKFMKKKENLS